MKKEKMSRMEKIQIKCSQRHRQRAEAYAINAYLKSLEQQRYEEMLESKNRGETKRSEPWTYDSDSSLSRDSEDSDQPQPQPQHSHTDKSCGPSSKKPIRAMSPAPNVNIASRSNGV
jgi:hypothetical protein